MDQKEKSYNHLKVIHVPWKCILLLLLLIATAGIILSQKSGCNNSLFCESCEHEGHRLDFLLDMFYDLTLLISHFCLGIVFTKCLLCARNYSKCHIWISSFALHLRWKLVLPSFYRWAKTSITSYDGDRIWTQTTARAHVRKHFAILLHAHNTHTKSLLSMWLSSIVV
jgi:hypothetical protein